MNYDRYWRGVCFFFLQMVISSFNDIITKFMGNRLDTLEIVFFRFFFSLITLFPFILFISKHTSKSFTNYIQIVRSILLTKQLFLNLLRGFLGVLSFFLYIYSVIHLPLVNVVVVLWIIPIFSLILSVIFLHEKITKSRWIATLLSFVGLTVITTYTSDCRFYFDLVHLIPIAASFLFALQDIIISKMIEQKENQIGMLFYFSLITSLASFYPASQIWIKPTSFELSMLALLGFTSNCTQYFIFKTFSLVDVSAVAPYRYLELLISSILSFMFFHEIPDKNVLLGAFILIPSTLYLCYSDKKIQTNTNLELE